MELLVSKARELGPVAAYRVLVLEASGAVSHRDHADLAAASAHADDAAAEESRPIAVVVDAAFRVVHRGRAYFG